MTNNLLTPVKDADLIHGTRIDADLIHGTRIDADLNKQ